MPDPAGAFPHPSWHHPLTEVGPPSSVCLHQDISVPLGLLADTHRHICSSGGPLPPPEDFSSTFCIPEECWTLSVLGSVSHPRITTSPLSFVLSTAGPQGLRSMSHAQPGLKRHCLGVVVRMIPTQTFDYHKVMRT